MGRYRWVWILFVSGASTGGPSQARASLKSKNPNIKIVVLDPFDSPVLSEGRPGAHKIQEIGAGLVPDVLNTGIYDEIIKVKNEDAFSGREIAKTEGLLIGISSGAAVWAATELAKRSENEGKKL